MKLKEGKSGIGMPVIAIALIFLINPTIKTVDLLPDFIGGLIFLRLLTYYADRAPHFYEARDTMKKLCILSALKVPAFLLMVFIRAGNVADNDIIVLFTFVFAVFEAFLLTVFIKELFDGLYYMGLRTGADAPIKPFKIIGKLEASPDFLRLIATVFAIFRALATFLPEMLLLTTTDEIGVNTQLFNIRALYPRFITVGIICSLILGLAVTILFYKYIKAIRAEGKLRIESDALYTGVARLELDNKAVMRRIRTGLSLLSVSAIFSICFRSDSFSQIDVLPDFLIPIFIFIGVYILKSFAKDRVVLIVSAIYTVCAIISETVLADFLVQHGYPSLLGGITKEYSTVIMWGCVECAAAILTFICLALFIIRFSKENTMQDGTHGTGYTKTILYCGGGILYSVMKLSSLVINSNIKTELVETSGGTSSIVMSTLPWFSTAVFIVAVLFIAFSLSLSSYLKDECEMKYS